MDALKFIEERNRMCDYYSDKDVPSGCKGCPASQMACSSFCYVTAKFIETVEQWSQEHPRKTRQDVFMEQWPEAQIESNGVVSFCPALLSKEYRNNHGHCNRNAARDSCESCHREFWMQEVE